MALIFPAPAQIKNLLDPTSGTDAATKQYVDNSISGGTGTIAVGNVSATGNVDANILISNSITSTGNITAGNISGGNLVVGNYFSGNGSLLTSITGANVTGTVANANYAAYAGNITIAAQSNITSVGTLTGLTSNGTVNFANTSNVTLGNIGNLHISGGSSGYVLQTDGSGTLSWAQIVTQAGNANVGGSNTQIFFNDNGSNTLGTSANLTFDKSTKILTVDKIAGNGSLLSSITGGNVTGYVAFATSADSATVAGTVTTNSQPNITSTGTLTGLTVSGNVSFTGANVSLGSISNLHISGGTADYVLKTDGQGNLSWTAPGGSGSLTADVDSFTGDGSNTAFTLANTPAGENYTMVAVQGVLQPKSTYSLSGNVLTFDSAPPNTAVIEVTTFGGSVSAGGGGGTLTALYRGYTGDGSTTTYTVTSGITANTVLVATNGVLQRPTTDYTISGTTLTFVVAPENNDDIQIRELSSSGSGSSSSSALTWNIVSTDTTMTKNNGYFVDTSGGAKTMTLPSTAELGDTIRINDLAGTFATNNLTIARNGHKIQGIADNLLVDVNQTSFGLVYSNSTYGWKVLEL